MGNLRVDLHPVWNDGCALQGALEAALDEAEQKRIRLVEIIPGKGSGQLKQRVLRFLREPRNRARYHRLEVDSRNWGLIRVHFRVPGF